MNYINIIQGALRDFSHRS